MVTVKEQKANKAFCNLHHVFQVCAKIFFWQDAMKGEDSNYPRSYQFCFFYLQATSQYPHQMQTQEGSSPVLIS